jgi:hypothetical protein
MRRLPRVTVREARPEPNADCDGEQHCQQELKRSERTQGSEQQQQDEKDHEADDDTTSGYGHTRILNAVAHELR